MLISKVLGRPKSLICEISRPQRKTHVERPRRRSHNNRKGRGRRRRRWSSRNNWWRRGGRLGTFWSHMCTAPEGKHQTKHDQIEARLNSPPNSLQHRQLHRHSPSKCNLRRLRNAIRKIYQRFREASFPGGVLPRWLIDKRRLTRCLFGPPRHPVLKLSLTLRPNFGNYAGDKGIYLILSLHPWVAVNLRRVQLVYQH